VLLKSIEPAKKQNCTTIYRLALSIAITALTCLQTARSQDAVSTDLQTQSVSVKFAHSGSADGHRKALAERGITYELNYIGEWQMNASGGIGRDGFYIGRLETVVDVDLAKVAGLQGLGFHINGFQIHGDGVTGAKIGNLMPTSYIEALPTTRLSELWLEQQLIDKALSIRFGQLAADSEYNTSTYANQFINSTFGWPAIFSADLPSGGPAYPFAALGVRVKFDPDKNVSLLASVLNGDPAGPGRGDPQTRNRYGLNFRLQDPALILGEVQYRYNQAPGTAGLAGTLKLGGWHHFGTFDDRNAEVGSSPSATPSSHGMSTRVRGNHGIYGVIDQQIWKLQSGDPDKGVGVFVRGSASPSDRNLVDLYVDGGIVFAGLIPRRPDDVVGIGAAYAHTSRSGDIPRSYEALLEANYQAQIVPGLQIDLDLQRIIIPNVNATNSDGAAGASTSNATVLTLHTSIRY
jgi:porin